MTAFRSLALLVAPIAVVATVAVTLASLMFGSLFAGLVAGGGFTAFVALPAWTILRITQGDDRIASSSPPGLPLWAAIGVSLLLIVPPSSTPWLDFDSMTMLGAGFLMWAAAGSIWLVRLGLALASGGLASVRARWLRWLMPFVAGVLGLVLVVAGSFMLRFELSKFAFDDAADRARNGAISPGSEVGLGLFTGRYEGLEDGNPAFFMGIGTNDAVSIVELPEGTTPVDGEWTIWKHLDGGWWLRRDLISD